LHLDIFDSKRKNLLPGFEIFKKDFCLAGGTALALQIGHRISTDFDFFCPQDIDTVRLFSDLKEDFAAKDILKIQEEKNTLTVLLAGIKVSFFSYKYPLVKRRIKSDYFELASLEDIGCMKLAAILGRSDFKDFVDIYFILQTISLYELLLLAEKKFKDTDVNVFLKSLVYFDEIKEEPIQFLNGKKISLEKIKLFLTREVKKYWHAF